jgi:ATP-dependent helicase HrpB
VFAVPAPLPIDPFIPEIVARIRESRAAIIVAEPGAGKTTRVPPALVPDGPVILLQPRRVAARSIARRVADEQGWTIGREVGWHVRFEQRFCSETRLLVATEGILTARLQQDPLLSAFRTIVLDEFHERSIHADLGIALARQAWLARGDLRIVIMSATIAAGPVSAFLGGAPIVAVPGRAHPIEIAYAPGLPLAGAVRDVAERTPGHILCFLPGAPEILRATAAVQATVAPLGGEVVPLHGGLESAEQDRAIAPVERRRVILATNIAETSLTVPGVTGVVDTGLHKVARYDPDRAIDSLETERISRDSADQRAGRAGRLGPGVVRRLWSESDRLRPHREADIHRIDLSGPLLDIFAWGGDPRTFEWFDAPSADGVASALDLLARLGAIEDGRMTPLGVEMQRLPLHPRLARILLAARGGWDAALSCALLSERHFIPARTATTSSDLLSAVERQRDLPPHIVRVATRLQQSVRESVRGFPHQAEAAGTADETFRRALLDGYPDRVAKRRAPGSARLLLASGHGAVLGPESGVLGAEYLVAVDVQAGRRGEVVEARVRVASAIERSWLTPTESRIHHELDGGAVRALERDYYGALVLGERVVPPDPTAAAVLLAEAFIARGFGDDDQQLIRRLRFAGLEVDPLDLVRRAAAGCRRLGDIDLTRDLPWETKQHLERMAPSRITVPSGRSHALQYQDDGTVVVSVKLQELFGLAETPRIGPRREPILLSLLAPSGRPVQVTRDLRSFWENTYPEVRKELRGRYPRHPWPDDPWSATPTAKTKKRTG